MSVPEFVAAQLSADGSAAAMPAERPDDARLEWLWSEYEKQMAEVAEYQTEGMDIYPQPGFVLKTGLLSAPARASPAFPLLTPQQLRARMKVFVNLCSDSALELPSMVSDGAGGEQLRVPISCGPVSLDVEKDGATQCLVVDIVLNPQSVARAQNEKDFRAFIGSFAMQKLEDKYAIKLDQESVKWPKMKYKGSAEPASHHIRRPKGAHVEEEGTADHAEQVEERRKAAALARIEAVRAAESRESGIDMHGSKASASAGSTDDIFLSEEAAKAASQWDQQQSPADRALAQKAGARIEVVSETKAAPKSSAQAASASASLAAPCAATAASPSPSASSLPAHSIVYLKSREPSSASASVDPAEWDIDLPALPASIVVEVILPLVGSSAEEMEVDISATGVTIQSRPDQRQKHQYQLHMQFPFLLDDEQSTCKFSKKTRTLTLTLPVTAKRDIEAEVEAEVAASAPAPAIDWQDQLGLTNTLMWRSCE